MQRRQLTPFLLKLDREDQNPREKKHSTESEALTILQSRRAESHRANAWRAIAYGAVSLTVIFVLASAWMRPEFNRQEIPDWKPVLALAEVALEKGELYDAKGLYSQAGRFAAWREDWEGLLAAACGIKKLDRERGPYSAANALLIRATVAAETKQSRSGIDSVAKAFATLGEYKMASMVLSRIQQSWLDEPNEANIVLPDCWK